MRKKYSLPHLFGCLLATQMLAVTATDAQNSYSYVRSNTDAYKRSHGLTIQDTNVEKAKLFTVLKELNKQKGVYFLFSEQSLANQMVNPLGDTKETTEKILDEVLSNTGIKYKKLNDKTYVILSDKDGKKSSSLNYVPLDGMMLAVQASNLEGIAADPITGKITGPDGKPVANATVTIKGSTKGTSTNSNGVFTLAAAKGDVLVISSIGYATQEITVGNSETVNISMALSNQQMTEVVVTALGVQRQKKSLGYSVSEVKGSELTQAREVNVMNSLVGKVAGLNVNAIAGGPGSSSNVIIRGVSSLTQTNQPLYVINGVPMDNGFANSQNVGSQWDNAPDMGDAIGNINPDDIESISVLKGAAASALYGYRAKAGVILITTKSAKTTGIDFNSNYVAETAVNTTDFQYEYGQGSNNIKPTTQQGAFDAGQQSWGAKLDGSSVIQFDGVSRPYIAQKDNIKNFYRTGGTFTNTIALNKTFDGGAVRFSANDVHNNSIIPNSGLNRQSFNLAVNFNVLKHLSIDARANYILEQVHNRSFLSDGAGNANYNVTLLPTSVDVNVLKKTTNADGSEYAYSSNTYATNPWFAAEKFINDTKRERLISSVMLKYALDNGFFVQGRVGRDAYNDNYKGVVPNGTAYYAAAPYNIAQINTQFSDLNLDGLMGKTFKVGSNFVITPNIGGSYRRTKSESYNNSGTDFAVPYVYTITNAKNKTLVYTPRDQEVQSVYGTLELNYKSYLYLTGSVRTDWFSTLATPGKDNKLSVTYPSVSGSFVFSELLRPSILSFGRLRVGYAEVGQATDPYKTTLTYILNSSALNGLPIGAILNTSVPNSELVASKAKELEIGAELRFFNNRLGIDVAWYNKKSNNEIVDAPASITAGYAGAILNIGQMRNKGFEMLLTGTPIQGSAFTWKTSVNGSVNNNEVISLVEGQASLPIGTSRSGVGFTRHIVGYAAAQVMAFDNKYDDQGKIVLDDNGVPAQGDLKPWGSAYAKWIAGWNNDFTYKRFNLNFLIDGKFGGKIFSATDYYAYMFGLHKNTLVNREGTFGNNLDAQHYYGALENNVSKMFVQDASFIKFRQVMIGYSFPNMFNGVLKSATLSLVARNLFTIMKKTDNIDPEANYTPNAQGLELGGVPPVRSYGINLNVKF